MRITWTLQLTSVVCYDALDNRTEFQVLNVNPALTETFTYTYKNGDEIESISKKVGTGSPIVIETFTSDDDGNLLTRTDTASSVMTTYSWTDFNRLAARCISSSPINWVQ
jgi:YD repeat-containing protein